MEELRKKMREKMSGERRGGKGLRGIGKRMQEEIRDEVRFEELEREKVREEIKRKRKKKSEGVLENMEL